MISIKPSVTGLLLIITLIATVSCSTTTSSLPQMDKSEQEAVLAALDAYMYEISANDLAAMDARLTPEGMTYIHMKRPDGTWKLVARSNKEWVSPDMATDETLRERYWSPTVLIRGPMALVWTPYEFRVDGEVSHCGFDAFSFSKIDGVWKVSNATWTVERDACEALYPDDPSIIRPAN